MQSEVIPLLGELEFFLDFSHFLTETQTRSVSGVCGHKEDRDDRSHDASSVERATLREAR